jgi:peptidoglycan/LPS O-acetylase OafA/YrhL
LYGHPVLTFYGDVNDNPLLVSNMRHFAVVLFFVLSGYVIGFTTKANNRGGKQYALARLSRLYSMVLPALVVSFIIECTINYYNANSFYAEIHSIVRYFITTSFMNEFCLFL